MVLTEPGKPVESASGKQVIHGAGRCSSHHTHSQRQSIRRIKEFCAGALPCACHSEKVKVQSPKILGLRFFRHVPWLWLNSFPSAALCTSDWRLFPSVKEPAWASSGKLKSKLMTFLM